MRAGGGSCSQPRARHAEGSRIRTHGSASRVLMRHAARRFLDANTTKAASNVQNRAYSESAIKAGQVSTWALSLAVSPHRKPSLSDIPASPTAIHKSSARMASSAIAPAWSGQRRMGLFRRVVSFITATKTRTMIDWKTFRWSHGASTTPFTRRLSECGPVNFWASLLANVTTPTNGGRMEYAS